jgi:hypothetical protein
MFIEHICFMNRMIMFFISIDGLILKFIMRIICSYFDEILMLFLCFMRIMVMFCLPFHGIYGYCYKMMLILSKIMVTYHNFEYYVTKFIWFWARSLWWCHYYDIIYVLVMCSILMILCWCYFLMMWSWLMGWGHPNDYGCMVRFSALHYVTK